MAGLNLEEEELEIDFVGQTTSQLPWSRKDLDEIFEFDEEETQNDPLLNLVRDFIGDLEPINVEINGYSDPKWLCFIKNTFRAMFGRHKNKEILREKLEKIVENIFDEKIERETMVFLAENIPKLHRVMYESDEKKYQKIGVYKENKLLGYIGWLKLRKVFGLYLLAEKILEKGELVVRKRRYLKDILENIDLNIEEFMERLGLRSVETIKRYIRELIQIGIFEKIEEEKKYRITPKIANKEIILKKIIEYVAGEENYRGFLLGITMYYFRASSNSLILYIDSILRDI